MYSYTGSKCNMSGGFGYIYGIFIHFYTLSTISLDLSGEPWHISLLVSQVS